MQERKNKKEWKPMRKRRNGRILLAAVLIIAMMPISAFAAFTDINEASWAKTYIESMADEGIVTGYADNTFKPNDNISKYASILMIYRTLKAADLVMASTQTVNINKHMTTIVSKNVPNWPDLYGAVSYCLENGIISAADLNNFYIGDTYTNARRFEVAVFLGKAMNIYLEENLNVLYSLDFKDASSIVSAARPYVYLLNKHDVINGDTLGYFNPGDSITRAAMAKMLSVSLDLLKDEEAPVQDSDDKTGIITNIIGDTNRVVIQNSADEEDIAIYNLTDVEISIKGYEKDIEDLEVDMNIRLVFEGTALVKLLVLDEDIVDNVSNEYDGTMYNYTSYQNHYIVTLKDDAGEKFTHSTADNAIITKDGDSATFEDFERGDYVNYDLENELFVRIEGFGKSQEFEGVFNEYKEGDEEESIVLKKLDGSLLELVLDDTFDVEKNGRERAISDLIKGDFIVVTTEYERVENIVASSNETEESGIIRSILIAAQPQITIMTEDNEEKTYDINGNVDVEVNNRDKTIYDLRLNYSIDITLESDVVTEIEADSYEILNKVDGSINNIYSSPEKLKIKYTENDEIKYMYVYVDVDETDMFSPAGRSIDFDDLDEDYKVFIYGNYDGDKYVADKIFVLE